MPTFSRAALADLGAGEVALFVSGTASIVGHETQHPGDVRAQTLETLNNLRAVLALVGGVTLAGAVVALAALQIATVRRKRREYALLKLTGHGRAWLVALPCLNAVVVALLGGALAFGVYLAGASAINRFFAAQFTTGEAAVRLGAADIAAGLLAAVAVSLLPALWGGWRASNVEAADELRDP